MLVVETGFRFTHPVILVVEAIQEAFEGLDVVHSGQFSVNQHCIHGL
jgi:hypothetical protein